MGLEQKERRNRKVTGRLGMWKRFFGSFFFALISRFLTLVRWHPLYLHWLAALESCASSLCLMYPPNTYLLQSAPFPFLCWHQPVFRIQLLASSRSPSKSWCRHFYSVHSLESHCFCYCVLILVTVPLDYSAPRVFLVSIVLYYMQRNCCYLKSYQSLE